MFSTVSKTAAGNKTPPCLFLPHCSWLHPSPLAALASFSPCWKPRALRRRGRKRPCRHGNCGGGAERGRWEREIRNATVHASRAFERAHIVDDRKQRKKHTHVKSHTWKTHVHELAEQRYTDALAFFALFCCCIVARVFAVKKKMLRSVTPPYPGLPYPGLAPHRKIEKKKKSLSYFRRYVEHLISSRWERFINVIRGRQKKSTASRALEETSSDFGSGRCTHVADRHGAYVSVRRKGREGMTGG